MRYLKVLLLVLAFAVLGVGATQAQTVLDNGVPVFTDGRINNYQIDAPVAIYCEFDHSENVNVGVFTGIQVWGLSSDQILNVTPAEIAAAKFTTASTTATLASNDGVSLTEAQDGMFTVNAGGYDFSFQRGDMFC